MGIFDKLTPEDIEASEALEDRVLKFFIARGGDKYETDGIHTIASNLKAKTKKEAKETTDKEIEGAVKSALDLWRSGVARDGTDPDFVERYLLKISIWEKIVK